MSVIPLVSFTGKYSSCVRDKDGRLHLDVASDPHDIINSEHSAMDIADPLKARPQRENLPACKRSLRVINFSYWTIKM